MSASRRRKTLIGSVGAQFRFPFWVGGRMINPYVNLTADDDFIGNGRIIQFGATSAPLIVNNWNDGEQERRSMSMAASRPAWWRRSRTTSR